MKNTLVSRLVFIASAILFSLIIISNIQVNAAGPVKIVIAASDSSAEVKGSADYVCTGENDHVAIQQAMNSIAGTGGTIALAEGTFHLADDMYIYGDSIIFEGAGKDKTLLDWSAGMFYILERENVTLRDFKTIGTGAITFRNGNYIKVENVIATVDSSSSGGAFTTLVAGRTIEDIEYKNCQAIDCGRHGWYTDGWILEEGQSALIENIRYIDCQAINCGTNGSFDQWTTGFLLAVNCDIDGCEVINCNAENNLETGFQVGAFPTIENMVISDCVSKNNGTKLDPDTGMPSSVYGAGFWLNDDITLYNCVSENNTKIGYGVWSGPYMPSLTTKLYDCVDFGSETGFSFTETENIYLENCTSDNAGTYGIWASTAENITTVGLKIKNPGGDGGACNIFGIPDYPVKDCTFDIDTYGGEGYVVYVNGDGNYVNFTGTVRFDDEENAVLINSGTNIVDISALNIVPFKLVIAASDSSSELQGSANYVCTGVDDHEIIQIAINRFMNTGGTVELTEGTFYLADDIYISCDSIIFEGAGEDKTFLDWSAGMFYILEKDDITLRNFKTVGTGAITARNSNHIKVENVTATVDDSFNGGAFTTLVAGRTIEDIEYKNCKAIDCGRHGWFTDGWIFEEGQNALIENIRYIDCQAINCGRYSRFDPYGQWTCGFVLAENCDIDGCEVTNCYAEGSWESGFHVEGSPIIRNMVISDCVSKNNGMKPDNFYNPDIDTYGCLFGSGFWLNDEITLYNCTSEDNRIAGYSVWSGTYRPSLPTKLYNCTDTGSEVGFRFTETDNVYLDCCISNDAGMYGVLAAYSEDITTVGLIIVNPGGDGDKCNVFSLLSDPVKNCSFDIDTIGGDGTIVSCINGENITFTGTVCSESENPVVVTGTNIDISNLDIIPYEKPLVDIASVAFTDINNNVLTELQMKEMIIASVAMECKSEQDIPATMIIALYDGNNTMKDIAFISKTIELGEIVNFHGGITMPDNVNGYFIKVFVWDNIIEQNPYSKAVRFPEQ